MLGFQSPLWKSRQEQTDPQPDSQRVQPLKGEADEENLSFTKEHDNKSAFLRAYKGRCSGLILKIITVE
jgi:hypothetical protein